MSGDHLLRGKARDREQHDGWAAGQRTLGAAAKESGQYPEKRGKLPRPTWKELPSFPGNRSQAYQARAPGNGNGEACDGGCHLLRCRRRVLQTASLPNAAPGRHSHSAGAQERRHSVRFPTFKPEEKPNLNRTSIILIFFHSSS